MIIYKHGKDDLNKLSQYLMTYDVISFDIFETTLIRLGDDSDFIFSLIQKESIEDETIDFIGVRKQAQILANKKAGKNASIHDIYSEITRILGISEDKSEHIKELEIELEAKHILINRSVKELIEKLVGAGKTVIFTSDMYIPGNYIRRMLLLVDPDLIYDNVFVSCDYGKTKHDGDLFDIVKTSYPGKTIVHLGDYWKSDFIRPLTKGIAAVYMPFQKGTTSLDRFVLYSISDGEDYINKWAYRELAPALWSFCGWIEANLKNDRCDQVMFLTREGAVFHRLFRVYDEKNAFKKYVLYASRRSLLCASADINWDWLRRTFGNYPVSFLEEAFNIPDNVIADDQKTCKIKDWQGLDEIRGRIEAYAKEQRKLLLNMLENDLYLEGNIGIVDIGWKGSSQRFLTEIFKAEKYHISLFGSYLGEFYDPNNTDIIKKGFLCSEHDSTYKESVLNAGFVFENGLSPEFGSTIGYKRVDNKIIPILDSEKKENDIYVINIQNYLEKFFIELSARKEYVYVDEKKTVAAMFRTLNHPTIEMAKALGDISYTDFGTKKYVARPMLSGWKYLINPRKLAEELHYSGWNSGFCLRAFKLKLPYYEIYSFLRKRKKD